MADTCIKQILKYLDAAEKKLNSGEMSQDEIYALDTFVDEIQRTNSVKRVRITKNGKSTLLTVIS